MKDDYYRVTHFGEDLEVDRGGGVDRSRDMITINIDYAADATFVSIHEFELSTVIFLDQETDKYGVINTFSDATPQQFGDAESAMTFALADLTGYVEDGDQRKSDFVIEWQGDIEGFRSGTRSVSPAGARMPDNRHSFGYKQKKGRSS